ncbi:MAG: hypothetical protein AAGJ37_15165 [Pseudomonadota bacterium]
MELRNYYTVALATALLFTSQTSSAQSTIEDEYGYEELIENAQSITFKEGFGETISPVLGSISWNVTDLNIPLNGLDINISRSLATSRFYSFKQDYSPSEIFDWTLDVPKMHINYWGISQSVGGACGYPTMKNIQISVPGVDGFDPVGRSQNGINYPNNTIIHYANNWLLLCESFPTRSNSVNANNQTLPASALNYTLRSPDGKKYQFKHHGNRWIFPGLNPRKLDNVYKTHVFYVTDIEDRFGNWLAYDYKKIITNATLDESNEPRTSHLLLTKIRSKEGVTVNLTNNGTDITGFSYGGNTVTYTPILKHWSGPIPPTEHLHKVKISSSNSSHTWTYEHEEFGPATPSGYRANKALARIKNPWGGIVEYTYEARVFGCSKNHVDWPLQDYALTSRTYRDSTRNTSVLYNVTRDFQPNTAINPANDFAYTEITYPDRKETFTYHCARFQSYYLSDIKDLKMHHHKVEDLQGNLIRETDYTWQEINANYVSNAFIWHDSTGPNRLVSKNTVIDDNYRKEALSHDVFGNVTKERERNVSGNKTKYFKYSKYNDVSNWLIGFPKKTEVSYTDSSYRQTSRTDYHTSSTNAQYASLALPYRTYDAGTWRQQFVSYHSNGLPNRIEFNRNLSFGSGKGFIELSNYKRGIAKTVRVPQSTSSAKQTRYNSINDLGQITRVKDYEGRCTNYRYTALGWIQREDPCGAGWLTTGFNLGKASHGEADLDYVEEGMFKRVESRSDGYNKQTYYDGELRPVLVRERDLGDSSSVRYKRYSYDFEGRKTFSSFMSEDSETRHGVIQQYDALGRIKKMDDNTTSGSVQYDYLSGDRVRVNDNRGYATTTKHLAYGTPTLEQPLTIDSPHGISTAITYDVLNNVKSISQGGLTEHRVYDSNSHLCKIVRPDIGRMAFQYNALGELIKKAHGTTVNTSTSSCDHSTSSSQRAIINLDNRGFTRFINYGDSSPDKSFVHDRNGQVTQITARNVTNTYQYNDANLLSSETIQIDGTSSTLTYSYDTSMNLSQITYPNGETVTFSPNALGQPTQAGAYATNVRYYPNGMIKQFTFGNGFVHGTTQHNSGLPADMYDVRGGTKAFDHKLDFDANGNLELLRDGRDSRYDLALSYDGLNRLDTITDSYVGTGDVNYDGMGNITYKKIGNHTLNYQYNSSKRLVSTTGSKQFQFSYDNRGNVTNNGTHAFTFNLAQQMTNSGSTRQYVYDGNDKRVRKTVSGKVTEFMYNKSGQLLQKTDDNGDVTNKIYLGSKLVAENKTLSVSPPQTLSNLSVEGVNYTLYSSQQSAIGFTQNLDSDEREAMSWVSQPPSDNVVFQYKIDFGTSGNSAGNPDVNWTHYTTFSGGASSGTLDYLVGPITQSNVPNRSSTSGSDFAKLHLRVRVENTAGNSAWRYMRPIWVYLRD